ncbi:LacI family DNA-binding transcriptional regulator [Microbacterium sp. LWH3-1.2]|uniref:LacI family DNA-binding transcriptional regulator n=1 Tax=Microbacterium sp. LWH3-1.2 TaxID=3135256 RepID=UPI00341243BE
MAARAGVGLSTVSNALNRPQVLAAETLARVQAAIDDLGYVRNDAARSLRLGSSRAIGVIVSEASSPFFADVTQAATIALGDRNYSTLVGNAVQNASIEKQLIELFESQRVRGLLIAPMSGNPPGLSSIVNRGVPVIFLDLSAATDQFCSVAVDDTLGATLAMQHLESLGRSRIALVRGPEGLPQIASRSAGALDFAQQGGMRCEEIVTSGYFVQAGLEAAAVIASRRPDERPDAIFAVNDLLAMGVVSGLLDRGIGVPRDIAVVGYDDVSVAAVARVPLTTLRQPAREIGARAAALLMDEIESPETHQHESTRFLPELIVRASTVG